MDDTISRQQAITALRALSDEDGYINAPHEVVTDVVRGLPPVRAEHEQTTQPEQTKTDKLGVKISETCEDCISRQAAIDAFDCTDELIVSGSANAQNVTNYINKVIGKIKALPPAQPERKTGKWLSHYEYCKKHKLLPSGLVVFWWCDQCEQAVEHPTNFCPNCGADMREGHDEIDRCGCTDSADRNKYMQAVQGAER